MSSGVHILNSHFVTPRVRARNDWDIFENFINYLNRNCKLVTIREAIKRIGSHLIPEDECMVAFTFDDGFEECHTTIAPILEKYNCNAAFFINSNYIDSDETYKLDFHKRINTFTKNPMSWQQVEDLHKRGHVIGSHTLDHLNIAELSPEEIASQLKENKQILENKLNYTCDFFAWTYGQFQHFPESALKITKKYHDYIFSSSNYRKYFSYNGQVINRRHIEAFWPKTHVKYFLSTNIKYK